MTTSPTRFAFNHRALAKLPPCPADAASSSTEYTDTEVVGLKLAVSKSGRKTFYFRYTIGRQKRAAKVGEFPAIDVADARKKALEMRAQVDRGEDPQAGRDALAEMPTLRQFGEESYMPDARTRKVSHKDDGSRLRVHVYPALGSRKLSEIGTRDIQQLLAAVAAKTSKSTANRVHSLVARMFKLAVVWGVIERSPCYGLSKFKEPKKAERFLSPEEIGRFQAALAEDDNTLAASALRLLLLTGLRRNEVIRAKWEQVDLDAGLMHLPKTKTGARYAVLNSAAKELVAGLPSRGSAGWVFPGTKPGQPMAQPMRVLQRALKRAGLDRMRVHDLRHTFAATCVNSGASLYEVQKLLGHSSPVMTQRYAHLASDTIRRASEAMAVVANTGQPAPASTSHVAQA
jgi:integrase